MSARTRRRITPERARSIGAAILARYPSGVVEATTAALAPLVGASRATVAEALADLEARGAITRETRRGAGNRSFGLVLRVTSVGRIYLKDATQHETIGRLGTTRLDDSHLGEAASGDSSKTEDDTATSVVTEISSRKPASDDGRDADTAMVDDSAGRLGWTTRLETNLARIATALEALLPLVAGLSPSKASPPVAATPPKAEAPVSPELSAKVEKASRESLAQKKARGFVPEVGDENYRLGIVRAMLAAAASGDVAEIEAYAKAADDRANAVKAKEAFKAKEAQWEAEAKAYREAHQAKQAAERERRKNVIPMPRTGS